MSDDDNTQSKRKTLTAMALAAAQVPKDLSEWRDRTSDRPPELSATPDTVSNTVPDTLEGWKDLARRLG